MYKIGRITKEQVDEILDSPEDYKWTIQGFGMLRTQIDMFRRLHVWTYDERIENVSLVHTHPWDFLSVVYYGKIYNKRFTEVGSDHGSMPYYRKLIQCGCDHELDNDPELVYLSTKCMETIYPGQGYFQHAEEIHESCFDQGSVSVITRFYPEEHSDEANHAYTYWPKGSEWVSAEPRQATMDEVQYIIGKVKNGY